MIALCDSEISERVRVLRKKLFTAGFPCAVLEVGELSRYRPLKLIITYYSAFNELRHGPYDDIFAIVIGDGFVNSALNAIRVRDENEAMVQARKYLMEIYGIGERQQLPFGILSKKGVFYAQKHFEVYGNIVRPTVSEYMIFKYLIAAADTHCCADSEQIRRFCYVRDLACAKNIDGNIAAHISNLNSKLNQSYGKHLIRPKRHHGYYFDTDRL